MDAAFEERGGEVQTRVSTMRACVLWLRLSRALMVDVADEVDAARQRTDGRTDAAATPYAPVSIRTTAETRCILLAGRTCPYTVSSSECS